MIYTKKYKYKNKKSKSKTKPLTKTKVKMIYKRKNTHKNNKNHTYKIGGMAAAGALQGAGGIDGLANKALNNKTEAALAGIAVVNTKNKNPFYKRIISSLLDRFVGNAKYFYNAFNLKPNRIDVDCIIEYDSTNSIPIKPHYIKLCKLIKTYYNPLIIKSSLLLDESRTITEIDKQAFFMEKKHKLYNKNSYTDHTQDLINLLSDNEFRTKLDTLIEEIKNPPKLAPKPTPTPTTTTKQLNETGHTKNPMITNNTKKGKGYDWTSTMLSQGEGPRVGTTNYTSGPIFGEEGSDPLNGMFGGSLLQNLSVVNTPKNNEEIQKKIENLFKVQTKLEQEDCDEPNNDNKKSECPEDIVIKPTHLIIEQQYLILDIVHTIYTDKHELYTNTQKDGIFSCQFNNLDNADPGIYVTALNASTSI
jgi:hypothetical protein